MNETIVYDGRREFKTDAETRAALASLTEMLNMKKSAVIREALNFLYRNIDVYEWQTGRK